MHFASAGPVQLTLAQASEMHAAIEEALKRLYEIEKEIDA